MDYKSFIKEIGFSPKENSSGIFEKKYPQVNNYFIEVDVEKEHINYGSKIQSDSKTTQNFSQDENFVVLECVNRLLEKGYKPENIILEKTWNAGHGTSGRLDICVNREDGSEYLLIECKTFGKEFDKEFTRLKKDGGQLFTYFKFSNKADVIMLYASELKGKEIVYCNEIIKIEDNYRTGDVKDFYEKWNKLTKDNGVFDSWVNPYNFKSKALTINELEEIKPEDSSFIFNRFLEILRHNVISDKGNAFNKIFTLFLCKIYDEKAHEDTNDELDFQWKEGIDDDVFFQLRLTDLYKKGMSAFLEKKVTDFSEDEFDKKYQQLFSSNENLSKELKTEINRIRLEKNNEFAIKEVYDKKSFNENAKVVKEVVELLQRYKIRYTQKQQYLSDFFELLLTTGLKQESGQFFTPVPIAQFIIKSLPIDNFIKNKLQKGEKDDLLPYVIDYAAGSGHFVTESMHELQRLLKNINSNQFAGETKRFIQKAHDYPYEWAIQYVYGIEKDYRLVKVGKVGCYLHGDGLANVIHSDGLASFNYHEYKNKLVYQDRDFPKENKQFEILISNPPYSVSAFKNSAREYYTEQDFDLYEDLTDNSSEIECLFVERTKQLLKDDGVAGVVLPSSILSNEGIYTKVREIILQYFKIVAITELGSNTFMATGTNTVVLFLRRRNNYDCINLKKSIDRFFENFQDVTLNGIEKPFHKYVDYVWEGLSWEDYLSLMKNNPYDFITEENESYKEYRKKINAKTEEDFWQKYIEIEKEKILYFILTYPQKVVLVKTGEKDAEKRFLGYEFSNRRGSEGIHPIQRGKTIAECTKLFDDNIFDHPEKASTYIYKAFSGDYKTPIHDSLKNNISRVNLVDMLAFDRATFAKNISLNSKKKVKIESEWEFVALGKVAQIVRGVIYSKNDQTASQTDKIVLTADNITLNGFLEIKKQVFLHDTFNIPQEKILRKDDIFMCFSSGSKEHLGKVAFIENDTNYLAGGFMGIIRPQESVLSKYLFQLLNSLLRQPIRDLGTGSNINNLSSVINDVKIPLPPLGIQQEIISKIEVLEMKEFEVKEKVGSLKKSIAELMNIFDTVKEEKLESISLMLKRGKSAKYGNSHIQIIKSGQARGIKEFDFSQNHFVDETFILDERKLEKGDVLINSTGVGTAGRVTLFDLDGVFVVDSHITILRPNKEKVLPDFVLQCLVKIGFKNIEAMAQGQSGQIELSLPIIQNIKIPLPPISEQQKIVAEIEKIENEITSLEKLLADIPKQKEEILKKYL